MKPALLVAVLLASLGLTTASHAQEMQGAYEEAPGKVPITATNQEALDLFLEARDLNERLQAADANPIFQRAVDSDPTFAMGYVGLAQSAQGADAFFEAVGNAVANINNASEGERLVIVGLQAGANGEPAKQREAYMELVRMFPGDERAHTLLGAHYFGQQDWANAIETYKKAIGINPEYSPPYNQLGYALRFEGRYEEAEEAFQKYIELIPDDPNPYDSYGELLMKVGRFDDSIEQYRKALEQDPTFVFSYVGIANNQIFMGEYEAARTTLDELYNKAQNDAQRRQALNWKAASYIHEGDIDQAVEILAARFKIAEDAGNTVQMAGDLGQMGTMMLEIGDTSKATDRFRAGIVTINEADVSAEVKRNAQTGFIYNEARVAIVNGNLETARAKTAEFETRVNQNPTNFTVRQVHELKGRIAMAEENYEAAIEALNSANQQDPRVLYLVALAEHNADDHTSAKASAEAVANWNQLGFNYAYVRADAQELVAKHDM